MIKRALFLPIVLLLCSCIGKHSSDAQTAKVKDEELSIGNHKADTVNVKQSLSEIHWKGTKMRGAGKHEGDIELTRGYLLTEGDDLVGGLFTVDMNTIGVTDIPAHETVPINRLNNHLKSPDFFDVENYPFSKLEITKVEKMTSDSLKVSGNLTLKDITKNIEFRAFFGKRLFTTKFTFDRFKWNIAYEGNIADKTLVDKDIELAIRLSLE